MLERGQLGEEYNIGGHNEWKNIDVVLEICRLLDELAPAAQPHADKISYVQDRPGHDMRYAIDASKIQRELGWAPQETFETGLRKTVQWYLDNREWCELISARGFGRERLGLKAGAA